MPHIKVYWTYAGFYKASIASRDLECILSINNYNTCLMFPAMTEYAMLDSTLITIESIGGFRFNL